MELLRYAAFLIVSVELRLLRKIGSMQNFLIYGQICESLVKMKLHRFPFLKELSDPLTCYYTLWHPKKVIKHAFVNFIDLVFSKEYLVFLVEVLWNILWETLEEFMVL